MKIEGKTAIVTGAAGGIGAAIAEALVVAGNAVVISDLSQDRLSAEQSRLDKVAPGRAVALAGNAAETLDIEKMIALAEDTFGPVDLYFANAGVGGGPGLEATDAEWDLAHQVNVMAHVRAAKLLVPQWIERGTGYFVSTASAAGLLTQIGSATYSVTKHGAVAFAEWLSVTYGDQGIAVSCLCPMGVNTAMLNDGDDSADELSRKAAAAVKQAGDVLEPADVAQIVLAAMAEEQFLILPHASVAEFHQRKAADRDRWIAGMQRYQASLLNS